MARELLEDPDLVSRVNLAAQELLENVVKYSSGGVCVIRFDLSSDGVTQVVSLEAENKASTEALSAVDQKLAALEQAKDPERYYDQLIRASAKRRHGSGLGLARIRAEGEMTVSHRVERGRIVVRAEAATEPGARAEVG